MGDLARVEEATPLELGGKGAGLCSRGMLLGVLFLKSFIIIVCFFDCENKKFFLPRSWCIFLPMMKLLLM